MICLINSSSNGPSGIYRFPSADGGAAFAVTRPAHLEDGLDADELCRDLDCRHDAPLQLSETLQAQLSAASRNRTGRASRRN